MIAARISFCAVTMLMLAFGHADAGTLQVSPVLLEVTGGSSADKVTLSNFGDKPINAQIRVFKWSQRAGKDVLEPTQDVIASPPIANIASGAEQVVRVVRVDRRPLASEASYRLIVDELPERAAGVRFGINLLMRYSIPVFFAPSLQPSPALDWKVEVQNGKTILTATNSGSRRVRVAELALLGQSGTPAASHKGLLGYVLGNSTAVWTISGASLPRGAPVSITAKGDDGPIRGRAVAH